MRAALIVGHMVGGWYMVECGRPPHPVGSLVVRGRREPGPGGHYTHKLAHRRVWHVRPSGWWGAVAHGIGDVDTWGCGAHRRAVGVARGSTCGDQGGLTHGCAMWPSPERHPLDRGGVLRLVPPCGHAEALLRLAGSLALALLMLPDDPPDHGGDDQAGFALVREAALALGYPRWRRLRNGWG